MELDNKRIAAALAAAEKLFARVDRLLAERERPAVDWSALAYRWRKGDGRGYLESVAHPHRLALDDLLGVDKQKAVLGRNTEQFVRGLPCNNALLWGSRGTGKSSLIKALLNHYANRGLRVIEVDGHDLFDLVEIVAPLAGRQERYVLFTDDLSFSADDASYRALKAMLDGSVAVAPDNVIIYATSNRRHLLPEFMSENLEARNVDGDNPPR